MGQYDAAEEAMALVQLLTSKGSSLSIELNSHEVAGKVKVEPELHTANGMHGPYVYVFVLEASAHGNVGMASSISEKPPSTRMLAPVMKPAPADARNTITAACRAEELASSE